MWTFSKTTALGFHEIHSRAFVRFCAPDFRAYTNWTACTCATSPANVRVDVSYESAEWIGFGWWITLSDVECIRLVMFLCIQHDFRLWMLSECIAQHLPNILIGVGWFKYGIILGVAKFICISTIRCSLVHNWFETKPIDLNWFERICICSDNSTDVSPTSLVNIFIKLIV